MGGWVRLVHRAAGPEVRSRVWRLGDSSSEGFELMPQVLHTETRSRGTFLEYDLESRSHTVIGRRRATRPSGPPQSTV